MKTLERMTDIAGLSLNTERRALADLETLKADLVNRITRIDQEIANEMAAAETNPLLLENLGVFLKGARDRQSRLRHSIAEIDGQIALAQEKVADAFREKKRFELVLETRRAEKKRREDRREQAGLDEMGLRQSRANKA